MGFNVINNTEEEIPADIKKSETYEYVPPITKGVVMQIYDLNTLVIATKVPEINSKGYVEPSSKTYHFTVDIKGIKVPSTRSSMADEKRFSKEAVEYLTSFCLRETVTLENVVKENNRLKADICYGFISLGEWLCHMGYAIEEGKEYPNNWYKYRINTLSV